jgi:hypothetical protein
VTRSIDDRHVAVQPRQVALALHVPFGRRRMRSCLALGLRIGPQGSVK